MANYIEFDVHNIPETIPVVTLGTGENIDIVLCRAVNTDHMCAKSVGHKTNSGEEGTPEHLCLCGVGWSSLRMVNDAY